MDRTSLITNFVSHCHDIQKKGLVSGSGGNVSIRIDDYMLITPSGVALKDIDETSICEISILDGKIPDDMNPSKETIMHLLCYRERDDIQAIVHVHSAYAISIASLKDFQTKKIVPAFTPGYAMRIGKIPILPYQVPGSQALAEEVAAAMLHRDSVLLANHGIVAVGNHLDQAMNLIEEIEENALIYFITGGNAISLTDEQIIEIEKKYH